MSVRAAKKFGDTAIKLFPPYRWDKEQEDIWMEEVLKRLGPYPDAAIEKGLSEMLATRGRKEGTPAISECIAYCTEAKKWMDLEQKKQKPLQPVAASTSTEEGRHQAAVGLMRVSPIGQQALRENWHNALRDWFVKHGKFPEGHEIEQCKRSSREIDKYIEQVRCDAAVTAQIVLDAADTIERKRADLAAELRRVE